MSNGTELNRRDQELIDNAVRQLVRSEHLKTSTIINLPILYPSGSTVAVQAQIVRDKCLVSDMGGGYMEADLMGARNYYPKLAREISEASGISFDGESVFAAESSLDLISGLITVVGNCSHEAAAKSAYKLAEKREKRTEDELYKRLTDVFGMQAVERNAELRGASNHSWPVADVVRIDDHLAVFDFVIAHHNSIVNVAAKMHDLARLADPPSRVAVTRDIAKLGDMTGVLSQASSLIELKAADEKYRRYADAA